ncbi:STAS domain-containing protein [Parachitinimonas caeni]|uniref:Anti-sigma factor antagonist n=1 Tax=Parachitinimonas caeni TaxID=3031301 RepID=A0ABT7DU28_9NEIS|nr:STAS domain-containing protein [Parachitinimonas caeni]MDK2123479.1 STAS domain-containing protein [Parachitinimonas caeni]
MTIHLEHRDSVAIFRPTGRLDSASSPELERMLTAELDAGTSRLVFDFADLDYISSAGLRVVLLAGKKLRTCQGKLALAGLRENVREVFSMSGFLALFAVAPNLEEALKSVA